MPTTTTLATSLLLLLNAATSKLVTLATFLILLHLSTPRAYLFGLGAILNSFLGKLVKKGIDQPRPPTSTLTDSGMPSSHATSLSYFAAGLTWLLLPSTTTTILPLLLWLYVALICYARVRLTKVHTLSQIIAGVILGSSFSSCWWYYVVRVASTKRIPLEEALTWWSNWRS